ncbi:MAG: GntR family transcriptional regulator [Candidatus Pacebacteria bacterium]|nr:GntR family transcriptional regulator [Candidatus Paceibacterota bacterium]
MIKKTSFMPSLSPRNSAKEQLRRRVETMHWKPGMRLPSEARLAETLGISRPSIHRAVRELESEGLIVSKTGSRNRYIRTLGSGVRTGVIGLLHIDRTALTHPAMQQRLAGIEEVLREKGLRLRIEVSDHDSSEWEPLPSLDSLCELCRGIDGLIVKWGDTDYSPLTRVSALLPVVVNGFESLGPRVAGVRFDREHAFFMLADELLKQGHREIVRLGLPESAEVGRTEATGLRVAIRRPEYVNMASYRSVEVSHHKEDLGRRAMEKEIEKGRLPTALICSSDSLARGALDVLGKANIEVPRDVSVVCFGSKPPAFELPRPLTYVRVDFREEGRLTALALLRMMSENSDESHERWPKTIFVAGSFMEGHSVAPPRKQ